MGMQPSSYPKTRDAARESPLRCMGSRDRFPATFALCLAVGDAAR
jgi:hypothetical protein